MSKGTATADYIMEDPREAMRLELKVNPRAWVQKYLAHRVCPGAEVLSVGCGPGVILRSVANLDSSIRATGIDISSDRLQQAREKNHDNSHVQFVCGDAQSMEFRSSSFDLVYCPGGLHAARVNPRERKSGFLHTVRQLKHDAERHALRECRRQI